jgi:hypothetical protein
MIVLRLFLFFILLNFFFKAFKIDVTSEFDIIKHANNKALMNALQIGEHIQLIQEEVKTASNLIREKSITVSAFKVVASTSLIFFFA